MSRQSQHMSPPPQQHQPQSQSQPQQHQHQQVPPLDPRLMPSSGSTNDFRPEDESLYQRPSQPLAYPMPLSTPAQTRVYSENRPADPSHAQPYYGIQSGRSPSEELQDSIESDRRQSGMAVFVNQSPNGDSQDQKRSRACEACRGLKVRCDMDLTNPGEPCRRCKKAGRQCVVTQPTRRRQKKSDTRVAELERKIEALSAVLQQQNAGYPAQYPPPEDQAAPLQHPGPDPAHHEHTLPMSATTPVQQHPPRTDYPHPELDSQRSNKRRRVEPTSDFSQNPPSGYRTEVVKTAEEQYYQGGMALRHELEVLFPSKIRNKIRDLVEPDLMGRVFEYFVTVQTPAFPIIAFAPGTTAEDVLDNRPVLMLAILFVGCTFMVTPELRQNMFDELLLVLSEAVIQKALKTLELVQALQVIVVFQKPVDKIRSASFYTMIHLAAVMALDLGLGKRFNASVSKRGFGGPGHDMPPGPAGQLPLVDSDAIEARRTWLVCYYLCASAAQVLRRPNLLRWTSYMSQCVVLLETSPEADPRDRILAQHIKIQHICEDINSSFALDDPDATTISITDPKVAYTLNVLESQVRDWEAKVPDDLRVPELMFFAHCTSLYLHEIALHVNHNTDDFRVPFTEASLKSGSEHGFAATLTQNQMNCIEACMKAAHSTIDVFCSLELDAHVVLPPLLYFVRIVYALIVLIKLHIAVVSPGSELGKIIRPDDVQAQAYLEKLWDIFSAVADKHRWNPHNKAQQIIGILRDWVCTHQHGDSTKDTAMSAANDGKATTNPAQQQQPSKHMESSSARKNSSDNLRLLSEAATNTQQQSGNSGGGGSGSGTVWASSSYDPQAASSAAAASSALAMSYPTPYSMRSSNATGPESAGANQHAESAGSSTVMSTPQTAFGSGSEEGYGMFGQQQGQQLGQQSQQGQQQQQLQQQGQTQQQQGQAQQQQENMPPIMDWTATMDFEQAVNVALQDLDFSGDLFGSFYGGGADAFQIGGGGASEFGGGVGQISTGGMMMGAAGAAGVSRGSGSGSGNGGESGGGKW